MVSVEGICPLMTLKVAPFFVNFHTIKVPALNCVMSVMFD